MNVRELILALADLPPDMKVFIAKDSEGTLINEIYLVDVENIDQFRDVIDCEADGTVKAVVIWP